MQMSDDDRILPHPRGRSPLTVIAALAVAVGGIAAIASYYLKTADDTQRQQLEALRQTVQQVTAAPAQPAETPPPPAPAAVPEPTAVTPDPVAASEPPVQPAAELPPLPSLDESDAFLRDELMKLPGWSPQSLALLVNDQLLRRFVTFVTNVAAGKLDHKSGPFQPIKGSFSVSKSEPQTMAAESAARYNLYVNLLTSLDPQQCAQLYRRYYPPLNSAYGELGEKGNFHALVLKAIQMLEATPDIASSPALVPGLKGTWKYADPKLEAMPAAQKQMLRAGWENVSKLKVWLRQLRAALLAK